MIPIVATPIRFRDLAAATRCCGGPPEERLLDRLAQGADAYFSNSGSAAFFILLETLRRAFPSRQEVVLPAYTADALVVAVLQAHLKPVLCDISLENFNLDPALLPAVTGAGTLAVVVPHMFGIPAAWVADAHRLAPGAAVVEDCAQALGSAVAGRPVGTFGDFAIHSFNRGKNIPAYGGGCMVVRREEFVEKTKRQLVALQENTRCSCLIAAAKAGALAIATRPWWYGLLRPCIGGLRERPGATEIEVRCLAPFQKRLVAALLDRAEEFSRLRSDNARGLAEGLAGTKGYLVPRIDDAHTAAFNRFPLVVEDPARIKEIQRRLLRHGIESSRMYQRPLHHAFSLGYRKEEFPRAVYFAERLLTLPVHPLVGRRAIDAMIGVLRHAAAA